jgi:hypothetical protein
MQRLIGLMKGWAGKPSHPPLTDVAIGAYTVGVAMLVLGALGVESRQMAYGSLLAISGGLIVTVPVKTGAWIVGLGAELLLTVGGYLGGTNVFVYGIRVLKRTDTPVRDALVPGHADRGGAVPLE